LLVLVWVAVVFIPAPALAQAKEIIAEGEYNMGDGETPSAAESRALLNAKRDALEQAGTYVRSYTKVKNATLTEDEIEVIASGIMEVSVIDKKRTVIGDVFKFRVKIKAVVQMEKIDEMAKRVKDRQVVEDYKRIKEAYDDSRREIEGLKKKFAEAQNETEKKAVVASITKDELKLRAIEWSDAGSRHVMSKDYDLAIEDSNKAISLKPDYAVAYYFRGVVYNLKGQRDKAIEDFNQAIALKPDYAEAYFGRGFAYSGKGQYDMAIKDYGKAIALKPDLAEAYYGRGIAYNKKGQYDKAIEDFNQAIALKPDYAEAYGGRGFFYILEFKNLVKGCADLEQSCALGDCKVYEEAKKGVIASRQGRLCRKLSF